MKIGIIGAMAMEIETIAGQMEEKQTQTLAGMAFTTGKLAGVPCVVVQCGAGKVNAAMCAQACCCAQPPWSAPATTIAHCCWNAGT